MNHNESLRIMLVGLIRVKDIAADRSRRAAHGAKKAAVQRGERTKVMFGKKSGGQRQPGAKAIALIALPPSRSGACRGLRGSPGSAEKKKAAGTAALRQLDPKTGGSVEQIGGLGGNLSDLGKCRSDRLVPTGMTKIRAVEKSRLP
ncbi:MAG: hypothetical protein R3D52_13390 [Xanthobacteraceae bacterium]